jgi:hypothetical protein
MVTHIILALATTINVWAAWRSYSSRVLLKMMREHEDDYRLSLVKMRTAYDASLADLRASYDSIHASTADEMRKNYEARLGVHRANDTATIERIQAAYNEGLKKLGLLSRSHEIKIDSAPTGGKDN